MEVGGRRHGSLSLHLWRNADTWHDGLAIRGYRNRKAVVASKPFIKVEGDKELINKLKRADKKIQKSVLTKSVKAGGKPLIKAARSKVPTRTGVLKKSLGSKIKTYDGGSVKAVVIGPRGSVTGSFNGKTTRPVNYAHLAEAGFKHNKSGEQIKGSEFLKDAYETKQDASRKAMEEALVKNIKKELEKGRI